MGATDLTEPIQQTATFKSGPAAIYKALMTSAGHSTFTGEPAEMTTRIGGNFIAYSGYITGINVELVKDKLIVQAWRANGWPKGHWSLVTYRLAKSGSGCKLDFTHIGVPAKELKSIASGWHEHYWERLAKI